MQVLTVKHRLALNCNPPASAFQVLILQLCTPHLASGKSLHTRASPEMAEVQRWGGGVGRGGGCSFSYLSHSHQKPLFHCSAGRNESVTQAQPYL